jgi:hypothetical protein
MCDDLVGVETADGGLTPESARRHACQVAGKSGNLLTSNFARLRALLDGRADFVAPFGPRTVIVPDVVQA